MALNSFQHSFQRIIGIAGGIATGKTTVSDYLHHAYGLPILDADLYAREAITNELLDLLEQRYGASILMSDRSLNRSQLAQIIFSDRAERTWLEIQIHPYVRAQLQIAAAQRAPATVVMVIPLLFEAGMQDLVTEIWVVACSFELELKRLMARNQLDEAEARQRIASQMPLAEKMAQADIVLDNSDGLEHLFRQVDRVLSA